MHTKEHRIALAQFPFKKRQLYLLNENDDNWYCVSGFTGLNWAGHLQLESDILHSCFHYIIIQQAWISLGNSSPVPSMIRQCTQ